MPARAACGARAERDWPILQGGAISANVRLQKELTDQASITYRQTVLQALQDVENALVAFAREFDHRKALNEAVVQNRKAVDLSMQLYTQGQTDFLSVLDAQRSLYTSETALSQSKESISTDLVALYKALGAVGNKASRMAIPVQRDRQKPILAIVSIKHTCK